MFDVRFKWKPVLVVGVKPPDHLQSPEARGAADTHIRSRINELAGWLRSPYSLLSGINRVLFVVECPLPVFHAVCAIVNWFFYTKPRDGPIQLPQIPVNSEEGSTHTVTLLRLKVYKDTGAVCIWSLRKNVHLLIGYPDRCSLLADAFTRTCSNSPGNRSPFTQWPVKPVDGISDKAPSSLTPTPRTRIRNRKRSDRLPRFWHQEVGEGGKPSLPNVQPCWDLFGCGIGFFLRWADMGTLHTRLSSVGGI